MTAAALDVAALGDDLTGEQRRVLQVIYDVWTSPPTQWPVAPYVDDVLDKRHSIDLTEVLPTIPERYLVYNHYSPTDAELRLTVAGIACCEGSSGDVALFLRALSWCVDHERVFQRSSPTSQEYLQLTSQNAQSEWTESGSGATPIIINKAFAMVTGENISHGHSSGPDGWSMTITRDVRRFRGVQTLGEYLAVKEKPRDVPTSITYPRPARMNRRPFPELGPPIPESRPDPRKVFVIHGRDDEARKAVFDFLRALDLHPIPWGELVAATGQGSPYNGDVVSRAFEQAQAVVVVLTPDDEARLHPDLHSDHEEDYERELRGQARPNVLLEAGMALMAQPDRTIFVEIGRLRPISDIVGRNVVRLGATSAPLLALRDRLVTAECTVSDADPSWLDTERFANLAARNRQPLPSAVADGNLPRGQRLASAPRAAEPALTARLLNRGQHDYLLEVVNRGGVSLRNVTWEATPEVPNWRFLNQVLPKYPYDELPPREYVRVPVSITMGGPVVIDITLGGDTPVGAHYTQRARLSVYG